MPRLSDRLIPWSLIAALGGALPAGAQVLSAHDDATIRDWLCVGQSCADDPSPDVPDATHSGVHIRDGKVRVDFDDTSGAPGPATDWAIRTNTLAGPDLPGELVIQNTTSGAIPVRIKGDAHSNAFYLGAGGDLGLGTSIPQADIHILGEMDASIRFEGGGFALSNFELAAEETQFLLRNVNNGTEVWRVPFDVGEPAFYMDDAGRVGIGTSRPEERLHVRTGTDNADSFTLFDAAGAGSDAAFRLRQAGTVPTTWEFRNQQSSGRLNVGIAGGNTPFKIDDLANNNLLKLGLNGRPGVVAVTGSLLVNNQEMDVPDYVFDEGYALRPLPEVQRFIARHGHLPDVPSGGEIRAEGLDLSTMQMTLLRKVEELTLYTLAQQQLIEAQAARLQQLETAGR